MKIRRITTALLFTVLAGTTLAGCGEENNTTQGTFSFTLSLESGKSTIEIGQTDYIVVRTNGVDDAGKSYTYTSNKTNIATCGTPDGLKCPITALAEGSVIFSVKETTTNKKVNLPVTVTSSYPTANGGKNYASASGKEAIAKRTEILGKLEKYAVESHLTGITLFENGGYVKYSSRLDIPTQEYITGYGFGILSEGDITADLPGATPGYERYYHSAQATNPGKINAMDDMGAQVSDLASYITSAFWGTKMDSHQTGYEWYPVLAKDKVGGKNNLRPLPVDATGKLVSEGGQENVLGLYNRWRIYVKTGASDGVKYRTNGLFKASWDNRPVVLEDYEFTIKMLLTGANELFRGAELAGDKTYGIKGAQSYYNKTKGKDKSQEEIDNTWNKMKENGDIGFKTGSDTNGEYVEFDLLNEIDDFTAMYTLSSSLYSPLPQEFVQMLGDGKVSVGAKRYGEAVENFSYGGSKQTLTPNDTTLSLGAYYLESWSDMVITFKKNADWFERRTYPNRYKIEGIKITTYTDAAEQPDALYNAFYADALDSCGVPADHITEEKSASGTTKSGKPTITKVTKGDSTFKLNVNSCSQERWDYLFGPQGKITVTDEANKYECKPWMSNDNFLNGLYWSINRKEFAEVRGVQPSIDYLSNAYLDDAEEGHSYNKTDAHKNAVAKMHNIDENGNDDYGYNKKTAIDYFTKAYNELRASGAIKDGTPSNPTIIKISINWMYQTDITEYGNAISNYFTSAFNDPSVCGGKVKLEVEQPAPNPDWNHVYNEIMMKGRFDLAFGAISGNIYNPLNFFEVLKSDNSSGFTLNWGKDTSIVDANNPLVYNGEKYSFDALWQVADHGGVVENGAIVKSIKNCYLGLAKNTSGGETNNLYEGFSVDIPLEFADVQDVEFDVSKLSLYVANGEIHPVNYTYDKANKVLKVTLSAADGALIDQEIKEAQKKTDPSKTDYIEHPFSRLYYNNYWSFELTYTLSIMGGTPVADTITIAMTKEAQKY